MTRPPLVVEVQGHPQRGPCPAQVLLDRAFGATEHGGDLGDREHVDEPERGGLRLALGQPPEAAHNSSVSSLSGSSSRRPDEPADCSHLDHLATEGGHGEVRAHPSYPEVGPFE